MYCHLKPIGGSMGHAPNWPKPLRKFCSAKKTDFRTNWPTPDVVQMQKKLSASGGFAP